MFTKTVKILSFSGVRMWCVGHVDCLVVLCLVQCKCLQEKRTSGNQHSGRPKITNTNRDGLD